MRDLRLYAEMRMEMSRKLEDARKYETEKMLGTAEGKKPEFHITAPVGWINDPNGFSCYKGEYHLFYQYYPFDVVWGPMHWGHCKTKDFIRWEQLPCALAPDEEYDGQGCFSGSAIEYKGRHYLMYTSVLDRTTEAGKREIRQTQSVAVGDGTDYEKLASNPVITADMLPQGSSLEDFRDPKIIQEGDDFYAVIGSRSEDGSGQIALFSSKDIEHWEFVTILDKSRNQIGKMWECPDFFSLGNKWILCVSPQEMQAEGFKFHNGNGTVFLMGSYDKEKHSFTREKTEPIDYGLEFYAPQTMETPDGRRIMIGWLNSWDNQIRIPGSNWAGAMTIPRELEMRNGMLVQNPVKEIQAYYKSHVELKQVKAQEWMKFEGIEGRSIDLSLDINMGDSEEFKIRLAVGDGKYTSVVYDKKRELLTFDRLYAGITSDIISSRSMPVSCKNGKVKLRILLDKYTFELFANDGEQAMTNIINTPEKAKEIMFCAGEAEFDISLHQIVIEETEDGDI